MTPPPPAGVLFGPGDTWHLTRPAAAVPPRDPGVVFGPDDRRLIIDAIRGRMPAAGDDRAALRRRVAYLEAELLAVKEMLARTHAAAADAPVRVMPSRTLYTRELP